jgi:hypothetical protein
VGRFFRDNVAIVLGVSLPIVVVLFFVLASSLPKAYVDPPQHDLLLLSQNGPYAMRPLRLDIGVSDGRLRVRAYKLDYAGTPAVAYSQIVPRLFIWSGATRSSREIALELPDDIETFENGTEIAVPQLDGRRLSTDTRAPDGYVFRSTGYGRGVFGLFFDRDGPRTVVEKDGAAETVRMPGDVPYWGVQFLAWVVE